MSLAPHNPGVRLVACQLTERKALSDWCRPRRQPGPLTMRIGFSTVDGVRIRHAESEGPPERTILLTSPWPESLYAFVPIWRSLARRFRLFAVDLPGFGDSEGRADLLSPQAMGSFLLRLIDECELGRPHIVGPDVGTSAALFAAASEPESVASVVVGNGGMADLERYPPMDPRAIVNATIEKISGHVASAVREDYLRCYAGERFFESMRYTRSHPTDLPVLAELLPAITTPSLVFAGTRDRAVPVCKAECLVARLPHSRLAVLGAGHFVWEEAPDAFSEMISDWVTDGHRKVAPNHG
jgi:pimeloyl-ACP methyl ester carboxylesterase